MRKIIFATVLATLAFSLNAPAQAASFNCRYAKLPDEVAICQDPELSMLDEEIARDYFTALNRYRRRGDWYTVKGLRQTQRNWLRLRHTCGYDADCIRRWMYHRARELAGY